jgi:hypothetical protein
MRHHAIVVTGFDPDRVDQARQEAINLHMTVSEVLRSPVNEYYSFFVAPDGSKEFWTESDDGDKAREALKRYLRAKHPGGYLDWVEVQYGDDEKATLIMNHSDE